MDFTIRKAQIKDLELLTKLFEGYRSFYRKDPSPNEASKFLKERINNKDSIIYVAENNNHELVGFTQLYPSFSSTRMKRLWILNDLFVADNYRGKGVSKKLINKAKSLTRETNSCALLLETEKDNSIANQLYRATNFELETNNFYFWTP